MSANTLTAIMPQLLARGLMSLREQAIMPRLVNGDYSSEAAQKGDTIDVPIPTAVAVRAVTPANTPPALVDSTPAKVPIALDQWYEAPFYLTDNELAQIDRNRHYIPMQVSEAIRSLANQVNSHVFSKYKGVYGYVGTAGTTPFGSDASAAINARKVLNQQLCPRANRRAVIDFSAEAQALALASFANFEQSGDPAVKIEGELGRKYGFDWYTDDVVPTHTAGTITTGLISKASTAYAVGVKTILATTAASTGACALLVGDIITFAGDSQTYVLTAAATQPTAATDVTLSFEPGLKVAHVGSEAVSVKASHVVNLAFHRDAFALAMRPLAGSTSDLSLGSQISSLTDPQTGITLRLEVSRRHKAVEWSFDALWGAALVRAPLACRIAG